VRKVEATTAIERGHAHFFAKMPRLAQAAEAFREASGLAPRWAEPLGWLAASLERQGDVAAAIKVAKRALNLDPKDSRHWISLGAMLIKRHHWKEAVRALEQGLALQPHYAEADARLFLAEAYVRVGRKKDAEAQWRLVSAMEPCYPSGDKPMKEALAKLAKPPNKRMQRTAHRKIQRRR
jgi:tetratricopeptide (TPR) repeat protein